MTISILKFILNPFNIFWLLFFISILFWLFRKYNFTKYFLFTTCIWFILISTPLLPNAVLYSLEDRYHPIISKDLPNKKAEYHIIVLGGGHGFDDRLPPNSLLSLEALARLSEGIRLHNLLPNSKLVLSGYSESNRITQAEMLQKTAILLGVDEKNTKLQKKSANTFEEAKSYSKNFGNRYPVILVTSAAHMPRAMFAFRQFDVDPIPSPANYRLKESTNGILVGFPAIGNIEKLRMGIYEYAGMLWYRYRM